ncbi:MAG: hypothetical protein L3J51_07430 [Cocleimonas sp.]|nr:hypothetical protein [Cocleimonas sp.]
MMKMIITLLFLVMLSPVEAKQNLKILFDTTQYQIRCKTPACHSIKIIDKRKGTRKSLIDEVKEDHFNLTESETGSNFSFYEAWADEYRMGRYLRIGYSITNFVWAGEGKEEEKHILEKCAIIDLQTAQVKEVSGARDGVCNTDDYLSVASFTVFKQIPAYIDIKSYLYKSPNKPTKMYLIKGDKVTLLDEETDNSGQKWYFINYKGKKDLNMWIKAEAVDLESNAEKTEKETKKEAEPKPAEEPEIKKLEPATETATKKPIKIAQQTLDTNAPKNAEIIKAEKAELIKTAKGSTSFALLASMFGLLSLRLKNIM